MSTGGYDIVSTDSYGGGFKESYDGGTSGEWHKSPCEFEGELDLYTDAKWPPTTMKNNILNMITDRKENAYRYKTTTIIYTKVHPYYVQLYVTTL